MADIFIGKLIREELKSQRKSVVWLSSELGCNRTNIYKIFNRQSIDADLLLRISRLLGKNFFVPYVESFPEEEAAVEEEQLESIV